MLSTFSGKERSFSLRMWRALISAERQTCEVRDIKTYYKSLDDLGRTTILVDVLGRSLRNSEFLQT